MTIKRRDIEVFSMSFLDVISCGFGAIILLLVLSLGTEPATLEHITTDLTGKIEEIKIEREQIVKAHQDTQKTLDQKNKAIETTEKVISQLKEKLRDVQTSDIADNSKEQSRIKDKLKTVQQSLTDEMKRLYAATKPKKKPIKDAAIGGIPVDSEYIIFVIDTSGSMLKAAWPTVIKKIEEVLSVYPKVKGIQVVNDMGHYMFGEYAGQWIIDSPGRRKSVIRKLRTWKSYSNSSPVEGIKHAVRVYYKKNARISIFVFGDDFAGGSYDNVLKEVARINKQDASGKSRVRIHAFGFPVLFKYEKMGERRSRFAHLMRLLAEQNSGSFVGLTVLDNK